MSPNDAVRLLSLPLEQNAIDMAAGTSTGQPRVLFLNALSYAGSVIEALGSIECVQHMRGEYLALEGEGANVSPDVASIDPEISQYQLGMLLLTKHRGLNEAHVNQMIRHVEAGKPIIVAGSKTSGIASLRKAVSKQVEIEDSLSKFHGVVFWFRNTGNPVFDENAPTEILLDDGLVAETSVGMFSHKKVDTGSDLLADLIEADFAGKLTGSVADFGSGWGYLGMRILNLANHKIERFSSYEADHRAINACKANLERMDTNVPLAFHWQDLVSETVPREHDWIITNPPFHDGRHADPELGRAFIRRVADALKPHGKMLLVANIHLPYERQLQQLFPRHKTLAEAKGFKIIQAWR